MFIDFTLHSIKNQIPNPELFASGQSHPRFGGFLAPRQPILPQGDQPFFTPQNHCGTTRQRFCMPSCVPGFRLLYRKQINELLTSYWQTISFHDFRNARYYYNSEMSFSFSMEGEKNNLYCTQSLCLRPKDINEKFISSKELHSLIQKIFPTRNLLSYHLRRSYTNAIEQYSSTYISCLGKNPNHDYVISVRNNDVEVINNRW